MSRNIHQPASTERELANLRKRLESLDRVLRVMSGATVKDTGVPSDADFDAPPRDGTMVVVLAPPRLYVRAGGAWRYTALT